MKRDSKGNQQVSRRLRWTTVVLQYLGATAVSAPASRPTSPPSKTASTLVSISAAMPLARPRSSHVTGPISPARTSQKT